MTTFINNRLHPDDAYNVPCEDMEIPKSRSQSRERSRSPSIKEKIKDFFKKSDNEASDTEEEDVKSKKKITKMILKAAEKGVAKAIESNLHHHCTDCQLSDTSVAGAKMEDTPKNVNHSNEDSCKTFENGGSGI